MVLNPIKRSLLDEFRRDRGQREEAEEILDNKKEVSRAYNKFLEKVNQFNKYVEKFSTNDLVYYFKFVADENKVKYSISLSKDLAIMKRLKGIYTNKEICAMIEFLFESNQNYIAKRDVSLNILGSKWINTIYNDMKLWVENKYEPRLKNKKSKRSESLREWERKSSDDVRIGVEL